MFDGLDTSVHPLLVDPGQLSTWAPRVRPHLDKMGDGSNGRYLGTDILAAIAAGRMQLWLGMDAGAIVCVAVTEVISYPRRRAMRLIGAVGSRPRLWRVFRLGVEAAARDNFGCNLMEAFHVPRFKVLLRDYRTTHWFGEKSL